MQQGGAVVDVSSGGESMITRVQGAGRRISESGGCGDSSEEMDLMGGRAGKKNGWRLKARYSHSGLSTLLAELKYIYI